MKREKQTLVLLTNPAFFRLLNPSKVLVDELIFNLVLCHICWEWTLEDHDIAFCPILVFNTERKEKKLFSGTT